MIKKNFLDLVVESCVVPTLDKVSEISDTLKEKKIEFPSPPPPSVMMVLGQKITEGGKRALTSYATQKITKDVVLKTMSQASKAGALGAVCDGALALTKGAPLYKEEIIDKKDLTSYVAYEAGCGLTSSTAGALGTAVTSIILGASGAGAAPLIVGLGTAVSARRFYRGVVKNPLEEVERKLEEAAHDKEEGEEDLNRILNDLDGIWKDR